MARIRLLRVVLILAALLLSSAPLAVPLAAQNLPEAHEEVVYNGEIFNSAGYFGQLFPQAEKTIYVIADQPNVLIPKRTMVYWWPITQEYKADLESLNVPLTGTLEIGDLTFAPQPYSLKYDGSYNSADTSLLVGDGATQGSAAYSQAIRDYNAAALQYIIDRTTWEGDLSEWGKQVDAARAKGLPTDTIPVPTQPTPPTQPTTIVTTPAQGIPFAVPAGEYALHLRDENGAIVPGSERTLIAIEPRRDGVAYNVLASDKYTIPETSTDPNDTIYVSGENALYLQPALEKEYDNYAAAKLLNVQDRTAQARAGVWAWVPSGDLAGDTLEMTAEGAAQSLPLQTFYVKQSPGAALGYDILPWDESVTGQATTFDAFKISPELGVTKIVAPAQSGSAREIRVVRTGSGMLLVALAFVPLAVGAVHVAQRRWRTR